MRNIETFGKYLAYILAAVFYLNFFNSDIYLIVLGIVVMVFMGIPHGAIDHILPTSYLKNNGFLLFILKYLGVVVAYSILWFFFPLTSLIIFIVISAYHFGQVHYVKFQQLKTPFLLYLTTGFLLLSIILISDFQKTQEILMFILNIEPISSFKNYVIVFISTAFIVTLAIQSKEVIITTCRDIIPLIILLYLCPLLLSFILYFGFWHSLPMLIIEYKSLKYLQKNLNVYAFYKKLIPLTLISLIGISFILIYSHQFLETSTTIMIFFILISVISAPHIVVMDEFLKFKNLKLTSR
jgi:beta-carotene 15,15'-dioxygenase